MAAQVTISQTDALLRRGFKYFNRFMLLLWRLGLGRWVNIWPAVGGRIMVLTQIGRRSGKPRSTPLNYAEVAGELYCVAGFGQVADWYRNLLAYPAVEIWLPTGWWRGVAEDITDCAEATSLLRAVLINSGFAAYAAGLSPAQMSDDELRQATANYRLVHIQRNAGSLGAQGPADLAWVWTLSTFILILYALSTLGRNQHDER